MAMINAFGGKPTNLSADEIALIARREKLLGPAYRLFYENPVHVVRGEGVWLYDPQGNAYLDAYNNVVSVGHCHPHVVQAIAKQAAVLNTLTRYLNETVVTYADRLLATRPPSPPDSSRKPGRRSARRAACSSPTRCSQVSAAPARRCGALSAMASSPTSSPWSSLWVSVFFSL